MSNQGEYGLVIFTFDGNEIVSYIFIPFRSLEDAFEKDGGKQMIKNISAWLESYDGSLDDLGAALSELEEYCRGQAEFYDKWSEILYIPSVGGLGIGIGAYFANAILWSAVGLSVGVPVLVAGLYCSRREGMWRGQSDILLDYYKKYWSIDSQYPE